MKNMGKEKVAVKTGQAVTTVLQEQIREPISLYWKIHQKDKGSQAIREEKTLIQQDLKATVLDKEEVTLNVAIHVESAEEVKGRSDNYLYS
jgi:hypothetical protein